MAEEMTANELDLFEEEPSPVTQQQSDPFSSNVSPQSSAADEDDSGIADLLESNGISDPSRIKFEGPDGTIVERDWDDLSRDEQMNVIKTSSAPQQPRVNLTNEEVDFLNRVRANRMTPNDYLRAVGQAAQDAIPDSHEVDNISDDELFVLDALDRFGDENITDAQLETLLDNAKSDPDLYQKTIENLRGHYKQKEDEIKYQRQQAYEDRREREYNDFSESVLDEIQSLQPLAGYDMDLSTNDMNDLANFILTRDDNGNTEFGKAMNNPKVLTRVAFWALKGNDVMNEMSSQIRMAYERGVEVGRRGQSQLAFNRNRDGKTQASSVKMASDLDVR